MKTPTLQSVLLLGALLSAASCARRVPNGVLAPDDPVQELIPPSPTLVVNGIDLAPLATFEVTARVLGAKRYWLDREAKLAPLDLALGWGPMSNSGVLEDLEITQMARTFQWSAEEMPLEREQLESHAANMHIIPGNAAAKAVLFELRKGDVVTLRGILVQARTADGWIWTSSLNRTDTGDGACELMLVQSAQAR